MESKVNYTVVGIFVLLLGAAGIIIPLWLSSGLDQQQYNTYLVDMNESVDGLSSDAPVNYNGVNVGYVKDIKLNPHNTQEVELTLNIKSGTPITTNTTATLQSQGVTGFVYVGLTGGALEGAEPLHAKSGEPFPKIQAAPSIRVRLDTALTQLMGNIDTLSHQLSNLLTPENEKLFNEILSNTNKLSYKLSLQTAQLDNTLNVFNQNVPATMNQLQNVLSNLQVITNDVKQNPSILVRGKTTAPLGPGESK